MDTKTHAAAACAIFDALPRDAQEFLRLSDLELRHWAKVPDQQDRDNLIETGCASGVEAHDHSYKLAPDGKTHLTGSAPTVIARAPIDCVSACREGHFNDAREIMVKAFSHYAVDLCTPFHVSRELTGEQHSVGEKAMSKLAIPSPIVAVPFANPKSLHLSCIAAAEQTHALFVPRLLKGEDIKGELGTEILAHAVGFGLSVAHYIWRYVSKAD